MRTRFESGRGGRRDDVDAEYVVWGEAAGGDHARRANLASREGGRPMLRCSSNVVRHRIWRRPLARHAECVALGEGTDTDVAGADQREPLGSLERQLYLCRAPRSPCPA